jgi:hypothetical protein
VATETVNLIDFQRVLYADMLARKVEKVGDALYTQVHQPVFEALPSDADISAFVQQCIKDRVDQFDLLTLAQTKFPNPFTKE